MMMMGPCGFIDYNKDPTPGGEGYGSWGRPRGGQEAHGKSLFFLLCLAGNLELLLKKEK